MVSCPWHGPVPRLMRPIGIMENQMETTIMGYISLYRVYIGVILG